jgi:truncated hemoglobin YjbI
VFYQLNQKSFIREALASYLDTKSEFIQQKDLRYKELFHEQVLTKISYYLIKKYPNAVILRDHELALNNEAQNIISGLVQADQMKPDLLFLISTSGQSRKISIAIEYERTAKSKDRMHQKLNFYTQSTRVDGVIYFYSKNRIDHNLNDLFIDHVLEKSLRIKHFGKNFLLTSELYDDVEKSMKLLKNRNGNYYSFQNWLDCLTTSSASNRRDEYFIEVCSPGVIQL